MLLRHKTTNNASTHSLSAVDLMTSLLSRSVHYWFPNHNHQLLVCEFCGWPSDKHFIVKQFPSLPNIITRIFFICWWDPTPPLPYSLPCRSVASRIMGLVSFASTTWCWKGRVDLIWYVRNSELWLVVLATPMSSYQDGYQLVTVHTHDNIILLPHWEIRLPAPWHDIPFSHIILTPNEPVLTLS